MLFRTRRPSFRPDSGQMEEDLNVHQLEQLNQIMFIQEDQLQAQDQFKEDLINENTTPFDAQFSLKK